ncbi:uncharacterized protein LOC132194440 [Neocloeon triangulifer]|uniref:uncharacterized protein LOC132194440 n=1 Tax=Neocloeon triangulifer TaxID=2078957 RepID=UPI00286F0E80|nr:uncharacterized protein LOC132194440 [Neocloeon triangulifer]
MNDIVQQADCLYRNLYKFNYITTLDVDEVIVPISKDNWHDLVYEVAVPRAAQQNKSFAGFVSKNTFFLDYQIEQQAWYADVPKYMHMLQNVHRKDFYYPVNHTRKHSKTFFDVDKILSIFCHYPRDCITKECDYLIFDPSESQLQHYCVGQGRSHGDCKNTTDAKIVQDTSLWKYKDELVTKTNKVLKETGFLK